MSASTTQGGGDGHNDRLYAHPLTKKKDVATKRLHSQRLVTDDISQPVTSRVTRRPAKVGHVLLSSLLSSIRQALLNGVKMSDILIQLFIAPYAIC